MAFTGIDAVVFGVSDMTQSKRFLDDWGTRLIEADADRLVYQTKDGGQIIVRPKDAADLPPPIEPGNTVREVIWGAPSEAELQSGLDRLAAPLSVGPDGLPRMRDPNGLSLAFRVSQRTKVAVTPTPVNGPGVAQRIDRRSPVYDHAEPVKIGHIVLFANDFAAMRAFYTERMGFIISDEYPNHGAFLRCQIRGEHHNLFILNRPNRPGVNHVAFTVSDIHEVIGGGLAMSRKGWARAGTRSPPPISGILKIRSVPRWNTTPTTISAPRNGGPARSSASPNSLRNGPSPAASTASPAGRSPQPTRAAGAMPEPGSCLNRGHA